MPIRRTDRSVATSASPVDVMTASEITRQSTANMIDTVKNVAPSFFASQNTIADAGTFVRSPNLYGLLGDQVFPHSDGPFGMNGGVG